jgi:hypothetical protein
MLWCVPFLGYRLLNSIIIAWQDETTDALREHNGRFRFTSSHEGPYMRRGSCTTNSPRACWDLQCFIRPGPGHILGDVSSTLLLPATCITQPLVSMQQFPGKAS